MQRRSHFRTTSTFLAPLVLTLVALLILAGAGIFVYLLTTQGLSSGEWILSSVVLVVVTAVLTGCLLSHHRIEIGDDNVRLIWFPLYVKTIPADQLRSVASEVVNPWHTGLGLRMLGGGTLGLINRGGPALSIHTESGARYLVAVPVEEERAEITRRISTLITAWSTS
ncbi:hypothetical protein [Mycetocola saprophilus]|uniref:hypothetical protein n=1 Tax=Mycetocola saprophilus TaxID=76636 RepID=UPI003BF30B74